MDLKQTYAGECPQRDIISAFKNQELNGMHGNSMLNLQYATSSPIVNTLSNQMYSFPRSLRPLQ